MAPSNRREGSLCWCMEKKAVGSMTTEDVPIGIAEQDVPQFKSVCDSFMKNSDVVKGLTPAGKRTLQECFDRILDAIPRMPKEAHDEEAEVCPELKNLRSKVADIAKAVAVQRSDVPNQLRSILETSKSELTSVLGDAAPSSEGDESEAAEFMPNLKVDAQDAVTAIEELSAVASRLSAIVEPLKRVTEHAERGPDPLSKTEKVFVDKENIANGADEKQTMSQKPGMETRVRAAKARRQHLAALTKNRYNPY